MNDFETQIAIFQQITNNKITKQFKENYTHLFQEDIFKHLLGLNSKYIIKLYDLNLERKILTFEYFKSTTLREALKLEENIKFESIKNILKDIAVSIDFLHENNIAHIDINDTNILINNEFEIKLNDFDFIEILTPDNDELKNIDIHSYIILAYRIIHLPNQWKSISRLKFNFSKDNLDYSSCSKFFYSLKLEEDFK